MSDARRYTLLGLIGRGGQGDVYHARMEGPQGFQKDVAIKLLKPGLTQDSITRFRDEARILGLVRDRSVITVDAPTRLGDQWAIVMELVDGASLNTVLARGALPPSVALEVVGEIARVLDKVTHAERPDGTPLGLLHRDIKPGNIQVTREGEVKLLDFGVARADFDQRESHTVAHIGGTVGFIAPERTRGVNGPECDVYSLGVTLRVLITAERPTELGPLDLRGATDGVGGALVLAERMRSDDPAARPSAREVMEEAARLRPTVDGPSLGTWARTAIPVRRWPDDDRAGTVLAEPTPQRRAAWAAAGVGAALVVVAAIGWGAGGGESGPVASDGATTQPGGAGSSFGVEPSPSSPSSREAPEEVVEAPAPIPAPIPAAIPAPARSVSAPAVVTRPAPPPAVPSFSLVDIDAPAGSDVWIDGVRIGAAPLHAVRLADGPHRVRLQGGGRSAEATVRVGGRRGSTRFTWDGGPQIGVH